MSATLAGGNISVTPSTNRVVGLNDARDPRDVGGKAATLARLIDLGMTVPPGIVITTAAFDAHLEGDGGRGHVESLLENIDVHDARALSAAARRSRSFVTCRPLAPGLREELMTAARPFLDAGRVVVRSSAVGEDTSVGSFAGQLDSILHVRDEAELESAVLDCWASYWSERAIFYRAARRAPLRGMGVVVQQQVDARAAGVLFTDAGDGSMLVEYVPGLADRMVAGEADPGRLRIDRRQRRAEQITGSGASSTTIDAVLLDARRVDAFLSLAERLEQAFDGPQDVEWVLDAAGVVHVVQSRPITALLHQAMLPPAANPSSPRVAWSNANVNENFPQPISPFLYSIASRGYSHYFRNLARDFGVSRRRVEAMGPALSRIIGVHGARMYYNLTSIHHVLRLAPFGQFLASAFDTFVGARGQDGTARDVPSVRGGTARQIAEVCVVAARTTWAYLFLRRRMERFEATVDTFAARTEPSRLATMTLVELRSSLVEFMDIRCHRWNDAALADAAAMVCYAALDRLLRRAYPSNDHRAPQTSLLKAIPDVVSSRPANELWALSRMIRTDPWLAELFAVESADTILRAIEGDERVIAFRRAFRRYLDTWGFRCSAELMLTVPSFQEAPEPVIDLLRTYARLDGESPVESQARQARERERETTRVLEELADRPLLGTLPAPSYASALRLLLRGTHASIRFRERARLKQALLYSRCRRLTLALGTELVRLGFLDRANDIFWLTVDEVEELASGGAMFPHSTRDLVVLRARAHGELSASTPPSAFEIGEGEYLALDHQQDDGDPHPANDHILAGAPACGGRVTARATVLADLSEAARLKRGEVLVTRQTDPGWAPAFFLISGLVVERGGMLSHGAIVAREFGVPCVVGVRGATTRIMTGSTVTVDGDTGHVYLG